MTKEELDEAIGSIVDLEKLLDEEYENHSCEDNRFIASINYAISCIKKNILNDMNNVASKE